MQDSPRLGFGLMRLPRVNGQIDTDTVAKMADLFLERGFTYFDTAYVYEGSEAAFKKAVVDRIPRDRYTIADKLPAWGLSNGKSPEDIFNESLRRVGVDYFDYYLMHNVNEDSAPIFDKYDAWSFVNRMVAEGKIKHLGFSCHGKPPLLDKVLTEHPEVEFVQLQINFMDWTDENVRANEMYEIVRKHGKSVTVMEPIKGGTLALIRQEAKDKLAALGEGGTVASYALRWVGSHEGIKTILSGMNSIEQMDENTKTFTDFKPLNEAEQKAMDECREELLAVPTVPCTACRYCCEGCPMHINIPGMMKIYNALLIYGDHPGAHFMYGREQEDGSGKLCDCIKCGQCESVCPQHIKIPEILEKASAFLDK
ncbi:MAG: aldo/keto reductase [Oscillospiraceae bacterium]|nr:aldo/keto reductase [Oscillospiraceae bacterium]